MTAEQQVVEHCDLNPRRCDCGGVGEFVRDDGDWQECPYHPRVLGDAYVTFDGVSGLSLFIAGSELPNPYSDQCFWTARRADGLPWFREEGAP